MPGVSVIVPARDAAATIGRTLAALAAQQFEGDFEVVVGDDGSTDDTVEIVERFGEPVRLVHAGDGRGPAAARNAAVVASSGDVLAFCDADCFPAPGWLAAGVRGLSDAGLVQGRVTPEGPVGPFDRSLWVSGVSGLWETANLFTTRLAFDEVGGFEDWLEPDFGKALAEDVWLGWRIARSGRRTAFCPGALSEHAVFERDAAGYVRERRRLRHFPAIVAKMPELRGTLCFGRIFLSRRTAAFDLALAGVIAAAVQLTALPLVAAVPYAVLGWRDRARHFGRRRAPIVAAVDALADLVGFVELVRGCLRSRTLLL